MSAGQPRGIQRHSRAARRRATAALAAPSMSYPSTTARRVLSIFSVLGSAAVLLGAVRYGVLGIPGKPLAWSDIQIPSAVGFIAGACLGVINGVSFESDRALVVVRLLLVRTQFLWSEILNVDELNPTGGKILLRNGRKVRINWTAAQVIRFMAPRHDLYDAFVGQWELTDADESSDYRRQIDVVPIIAVTASVLASVLAFTLARLAVLH